MTHRQPSEHRCSRRGWSSRHAQVDNRPWSDELGVGRRVAARTGGFSGSAHDLDDLLNCVGAGTLGHRGLPNLPSRGMSVINSTSSALVTLDPARVAAGRLSAQLLVGWLLLDDSDTTGVWPGVRREALYAAAHRLNWCGSLSVCRLANDLGWRLGRSSVPRGVELWVPFNRTAGVTGPRARERHSTAPLTIAHRRSLFCRSTTSRRALRSSLVIRRA